ncbi:MAG: glycoside hydrolase family 15 protein [Brevinematales bacterium]|nr:glycoside hydrolase family 15 protein [Brevinematales bacterium]
MKRLLLLGLLLPSFLFAEYTIKPSYDFLPFGNGMSVAVYDMKKGKSLISFYDHIYKQYDQKSQSQSFLKKDGIRWGLNNQWLDDWKVEQAEYINGTGIVKIKKSYVELQNISVNEYYFMPMQSDKRIIVAVLELNNTGDSDAAVNPFLYVEAAMSSKETAVKKDIDGGIVFIESAAKVKEGSPIMMTLVPSPDSYAYKMKKSYPEDFSKKTPALDNVVEEGSDLIGAMRYKPVTLKKGQSVRILAVFALCPSGQDDAYVAEMAAYLKKGADKCLSEETAWWDKWHKVEKPSKGLTADELLLYKQSTAVLKMAQCREPGKPYGQILASMPPGQWNICWPRDASYSMIALIKSGHLEEAKACLEFMLNAPNGKFNDAKYVGKDYKISVCRYYGNGDEESDLNQSGPNLEWDDFGLFLWAFSEYVQAGKDKAFLKKYYSVAKELIADVLVSLMETDGYLKPDSSIWERHWEPEKGVDGKKHFAYSTINAYNGLTQFAKISTDKKDQKFYLEKAKEIKAGFLKNFIVDDVIVVNLEEKANGINKYMDAAVIEAVNFGMVDKKVAQTTLDAIEKYLKMAKSPGFFRNDDNTWYDFQEWVMVDLRIAVAYYSMGNTARAYEIVRWIVDNAKANFYLIPELLEQKNQSYQGAIPMAGFGAGVYIIVTDYMKGKK